MHCVCLVAIVSEGVEVVVVVVSGSGNVVVVVVIVVRAVSCDI